MDIQKFTEGQRAGEHILSEANGDRSRDEATLASGNNLPAGAVLGQVTADGKYTELDPAGVDGSEVAAGVLYAPVDATSADAACVVNTRDAELSASALTWPSGITGGEQDQATAELQSAGIILR